MSVEQNRVRYLKPHLRNMSLTGMVTKAPLPTDEVAPTVPFFILGSGRSGSTLLRMMLASDSRLTIPRFRRARKRTVE
jgi:hypothetical protein